MVTPFRLGLTRDQLASFLSDHEQIKQFEKLFQTVDTINTVTLDDVSVSAGNAGASANEALSQVEALQSIVQLLAYAPEGASQSDTDAWNRLHEWRQNAYLQPSQTDLGRTLRLEPRWHAHHGTICLWTRHS